MNSRQETRLLVAASCFLLLYATILTLAPAVREHSWRVPLRWSHWAGLLVWAVAAFTAQHFLTRFIPIHDPYIFPCAALLTGWGALTIWRLDPGFGARQIVWFASSVLAGFLIIRRLRSLDWLRRHKYPLLGLGLILTALTLFLGVSPSGVGPRLWLGCCGLYLQPAEPLKLLLVAYLAADLADRAPLPGRMVPMLMPTVLVGGLALILLIVQRDLGTACIFILLSATIFYLASGNGRLLVATSGVLLLAALTGFFFIDVVRARVDTWINPWNDPTGHSYQVVQSLISVANGGLLGRGPGLGSPSLVPVAQSDFIFAAIAEETGIAGTLGLLTVYALILCRGLLVALRAQATHRRLLAAGLTSYLGVQALFIVGGNLRMIPLAGVTLPFLSYGGSSLLISFLAAVMLLLISAESYGDPFAQPGPLRLLRLAAALGLGIMLLSLTQAWWAVFRGPDLLGRTDNPRRSIADRYVPRGQLVDRNNLPITVTRGTSGSFRRVYLYPSLGSVIGYTHPIYGQSGLEASLDPYLRGTLGNPPSLIWWNDLVYGTPPPGVDVRLSIDLSLQQRVDDAMRGLVGAAVLLNARSGEIMAMASHPTYDSNELDFTGGALANDPNAPLLDRATQGLYPPGGAIAPFLTAVRNTDASQPTDLPNLYTRLGFYARAIAEVPSASATPSIDTSGILVTPLQFAADAAAFTDAGVAPAPRIILAMRTSHQDWVDWPASGSSRLLFPTATARQVSESFAVQGRPYWEWASTGQTGSRLVSWYVAGALPTLTGTPRCVVILLEGDAIPTARAIGRNLLESAMGVHDVLGQPGIGNPPGPRRY